MSTSRKTMHTKGARVIVHTKSWSIENIPGGGNVWFNNNDNWCDQTASMNSLKKALEYVYDRGFGDGEKKTLNKIKHHQLMPSPVNKIDLVNMAYDFGGVGGDLSCPYKLMDKPCGQFAHIEIVKQVSRIMLTKPVPDYWFRMFAGDQGDFIQEHLRDAFLDRDHRDVDEMMQSLSAIVKRTLGRCKQALIKMTINCDVPSDMNELDWDEVLDASTTLDNESIGEDYDA